MDITETQLARSLDQTNLDPNATAADIAAFVTDARAHVFCAVAIMLSWIPLATDILRGSRTTVVAPIGFPLGTCTTASKVAETEWAITHGPADIEIDVVMNVSQLKSRRYDLVERDLAAVRRAAPGHTLKVIIELPILTPEEAVAAIRLTEAAGAEYVKTSTGFKHIKSWRPSTVDDVKLIQSILTTPLKIKVAGGVTNLAQALSMLGAGASRIGTSRGSLILQEYRELRGSNGSSQ